MQRLHTLLSLVLPALLLSGPPAAAEVVRPAPSIPFPADGGKPRTLASFKGQPLILLLADSPRRGSFKSQLKELGISYDRLAVRDTVVAAAFKGGNPGLIRTNVPVVLLPEGPGACAAFQLQGDFAIVLIGPDGNIDYQTGKVLNMNRILEVMQNSYQVQKAPRRQGAKER